VLYITEQLHGFKIHLQLANKYICVFKQDTISGTVCYLFVCT
jgi:hypothetical protein